MSSAAPERRAGADAEARVGERPAPFRPPLAALPDDRDVIVLGADLEGLATAACLGRAGLSVLVLEARDRPGGAAETGEVIPGHPCDLGLHDPGRLAPGLADELDLAREGLELATPDLQVVAPRGDGGAVELWREPARTAEALRPLSPRDAERWPGFVGRMERFARVLERLYAGPPPEPTDLRPGELPGLAGLALRVRAMGREEMIELLRVLPMSAAELLEDTFETDALRGTLGEAAVRGVFQGPRSGGTAFTLLHGQVGGPPGGFRPGAVARGGAGRLADALADAARRRGATIRCGVDIERILVRDGRVAGVLADGRELAADRVASALDAGRTLLELVGQDHLDPALVRAVGTIRYRGCWAKVNLALSEPPRFEALAGRALPPGTLVSVAPDLDHVERAYDDAKYRRVPARPALEAMAPVPGGGADRDGAGAALSVVARQVPYRLEGGWDDHAREALAENVLALLEEHAPGLSRTVLGRQVLAPPDLERRYGLPEGSAHGGELALDQVLFMRPVPGWSDYRTPVEGLYLCGTGTHPGGGIVGAAGRNAAAAIAGRGRGRWRIRR